VHGFWSIDYQTVLAVRILDCNINWINLP
jgi:hypothetical protein